MRCDVSGAHCARRRGRLAHCLDPMAKPIVKWAGGKLKLLGELMSRVPARVRTYAEPFAGGAALFFALASDATRSFDHAILADQNEELVACYRAVKSDVGGLI